MHAGGRFELQPGRRRLLRDGVPVALGSRAYDLLVALWDRRSRVVGKAELLDLVWPGLVVEENNLQVQIGHLRKVLGADAIATVPGRGYRLTCDLPSAAEPTGVAAASCEALPGDAAPQRRVRAPERAAGRAGPSDLRLLAEAIAACRRLVLLDMLTAGRARPGSEAPDGSALVDLGDARKVLDAARAALEERIAATAAHPRTVPALDLASDSPHRLADTPCETGGATQPPWE